MSPPSALVLCPTCDRHRRVSDAACPYCGDKSASAGSSLVRSLASRAALAFGGVALATAVSCSPKYGAPPPPDPSPLPPPSSSTVDSKDVPLTPSVEVPDGAAPDAAKVGPMPAPDAGTVPIPQQHRAVPAYGAPPRAK